MVFMVLNHFNLFSLVVVVCMYRDSVVGTNNWAAPEVLGNEDFVAYAQEDPATAQLVFPNHGYDSAADTYRYYFFL
jgi:hypothetical protein